MVKMLLKEYLMRWWVCNDMIDNYVLFVFFVWCYCMIVEVDDLEIVSFVLCI